MSRMEELRERLGSKRVAVMLGGTSGERQVSLRSGENILNALKRQGVASFPIDPRDDDWLTRLLTEQPDAVLLALHGKPGEDGTVQGLLEVLGIPYTGSGVLASAIAMNKVTTKQILLANGLPTPKYVLLSPLHDVREQVDEVADALGFPLVVKPTSEGSSLGISIVHSYETLGNVLLKTFYDFHSIFAEQYIPGMEVTVGILGTGRRIRALPVLELVPHNEFYDYEAKYTPGMTDFHLPARLSEAVTAHVQEVALRAHLAIGCHGYSRVDMRVTPDGEPFITEINTLPGMTDTSDLPAQAQAAGIPYDELVLEILNSAFVARI